MALRRSARLALEAHRERGQFWTPDWVADAMAAYVLADGAADVFDPAVGAGALLRAAVRLRSGEIRLGGYELDPGVLEQAKGAGLVPGQLGAVRAGDFVLDPPQGGLGAIVANPPYIRHHRLRPDQKAQLRAFSAGILGHPLDGRTGYHAYFLLRALTLLASGGRLAFILPADTFEGLSAPRLWRWVASHFRLDAVVTFSPEATPFPGTDINAVIVMISRSAPRSEMLWAQCGSRGSGLGAWIQSGFSAAPPEIRVVSRPVAEAVVTGFSRPPAVRNSRDGMALGQAARAMRGIATGCNEFFFLTRARASELRIPGEYLLPAVGRARDISGEQFTPADFARLESAGRPTRLFAPGRSRIEAFPSAVRHYLSTGEREGLPARPLIAQRTPWYRMERRRVPPFLFAYLGRRNARFIRNLAGAVPLTCLLCVYPRRENPEFLAALWAALRDPETLAGLRLVGKSYGGGAIKVEPRALERLALPGRHAERLRKMLPPAPCQPGLPLG